MLIALLLAAGAVETAPAGRSMPMFMSGCWEQRTATGFDQECWTDGRAGLMMGTGRYIAGGAIEHWEWMHIVRGGDGRLEFNASPTGDPMVRFHAVAQTAGSITFGKDDYPYFQRIRYSLTRSGMQVELLKDGKLLARRSYRRTAGPAAAG